MLSRIFFACLFLGLYSSGSSLSCRWMDHKFRQFSENSLILIDMMANHYPGEHTEVAFPHHLYSQASRASAEDKLAFAVQVLQEVCALFEEDDSSSSWEQSALEHFLNVVIKQADELRSCAGRHKTNRRLHMYFKRLPRHVFAQMGHSAEAWELIRREIKAHLMETDQLVASLLTAN